MGDAAKASRCGSNRGYYAHLRAGGKPCSRCKQAHADHYVESNAARARALARLARLHPADYRRLVAEEREAT